MAKILTEKVCTQNQNRKYKANIILLYAISFFNGMHFITPVIIPFFVDWGGLLFSQIMILQSIFMITIVITEVPLGAIADCISKQFSLISGFIMTILGIVLYSIFPRFYIFVIAEIVWGCATSLISGSDHALLYDSIERSNQLKNPPQQEIIAVYGRYASFRRVGYLISSPIGSLVSVCLGLRVTMVLMLIPAGLTLIVSLFLTKITTRTNDRKSYFALLFAGFNTIFRNKEFTILLIDELVVTGLCAHLSFTYQRKLMILGIDNAHFGWIFMLYLLSFIAGSTIHNSLAKLLGSKRRNFFVLTGGAGVGLFLILFAKGMIGVVFGIILVAGCGSTYASIRVGSYQTFIFSEERSTVDSTISMIRYSSFCLVNLMVGFIAEYNLSVVFLAFGGILLIWSFISPIRKILLEKIIRKIIEKKKKRD